MTQGVVAPDVTPEPHWEPEEELQPEPDPEDDLVPDNDVDDDFGLLLDVIRKQGGRCPTCTYSDLKEDEYVTAIKYDMLPSRQTRQNGWGHVMALRQPDREPPDHREPRWQLQDAKQRFSELVRQAEETGAQIVTRHGEDVVTMLPIEDYREYLRLKGRTPKPTLKEFLLGGPRFDDLDVPRSRVPVRPFDSDGED